LVREGEGVEGGWVGLWLGEDMSGIFAEICVLIV
jgi:hypothetical protein